MLMAKQSRLICKYDDGKDIFFLDFDENGRCTGRDEDGLCVLSNMGLGGFVGALSGRLYPANESDRQHMLQALQRHKTIINSYGIDNITKKPSSELKDWIKDIRKELKNIDAEIARLEKTKTSKTED